MLVMNTNDTNQYQYGGVVGGGGGGEFTSAKFIPHNIMCCG